MKSSCGYKCVNECLLFFFSTLFLGLSLSVYHVFAKHLSCTLDVLGWPYSRLAHRGS